MYGIWGKKVIAGFMAAVLLVGLTLPMSATAADVSPATAKRQAVLAVEQEDAANKHYLVQAESAVQNSMGNFKETQSYTGFSDVTSNDWFYGAVKLAFEYGLVKGSSDTTYNPQGKVTLQEAIVMAARLRCIFEWGNSSVQSPNQAQVGNADSWASTEINYAIKCGIIQSTTFSDYRAAATRAEMAYIFAHALPDATGIYKDINTVDDNAIPDVKTTDQYADSIYLLYRAGILTGGSANSFTPAQAITRAETAAIVSRLPIPSAHKEFTLHVSENPATPSNIPAEYLPVYVEITMPEAVYHVASNATVHMYGAGDKEYPLVSQTDYIQKYAGHYTSNLVFSAPLGSRDVPVTLKADVEGVTGTYGCGMGSYKLGETSEEYSLYSWSESPEFTGNGRNGLSPDFPIEISFTIDQTPSAVLVFKLEGTNTTVGGLQVEVMDTDTGKTITVNTTADGRIYVPSTMPKYGSLRLTGDTYTFVDGTPVAKFSATYQSGTCTVYVKLTSMP